MITVIILSIIVCYFIIKMMEFEKTYTKILVGFLIYILSFTLAILPTMFASIIYYRMFDDSKTELYLKRTVYLKSFSDNSNIGGSFFLGSGSIKENMVYRFYYKTNSGVKFGWINTQSAYIEESNSTPRIEVFYRRTKDVNLFLIPTDELEYRKIYIPKNSFINNYELDLN